MAAFTLHPRRDGSFKVDGLPAGILADVQPTIHAAWYLSVLRYGHYESFGIHESPEAALAALEEALREP